MTSAPGYTRFEVPQALLRETFAELRRCGQGRSECQVLWTSPWASPTRIDRIVHPRHHAHGDGFEVDGTWLSWLWRDLVATGSGIRVQVHTHPRLAFHSATDDAWPVIHEPGFLSLVIPYFATGEVSFEGIYLAELRTDGGWTEVTPASRLTVTA